MEKVSVSNFLQCIQKSNIIVTPTISLMQELVAKLNSLGLNSVYLGSAQYDKLMESKSIDPESDEIIIFITPEWRNKPDNQMNIEREKKLALIAIDEAHVSGKNLEMFWGGSKISKTCL